MFNDSAFIDLENTLLDDYMSQLYLVKIEMALRLKSKLLLTARMCHFWMT